MNGNTMKIDYNKPMSYNDAMALYARSMQGAQDAHADNYTINAAIERGTLKREPDKIWKFVDGTGKIVEKYVPCKLVPVYPSAIGPRAIVPEYAAIKKNVATPNSNTALVSSTVSASGMDIPHGWNSWYTYSGTHVLHGCIPLSSYMYRTLHSAQKWEKTKCNVLTRNFRAEKSDIASFARTVRTVWKRDKTSIFDGVTLKRRGIFERGVNGKWEFVPTKDLYPLKWGQKHITGKWDLQVTKKDGTTFIYRGADITAEWQKVVGKDGKIDVVPHKKSHTRGNSTVKAPSHEQNTSDAAKNSEQPRYFGPVEQMAVRCAIGAVKNAIAPRGKNIDVAQNIGHNKKNDVVTCYYDVDLEMCVSERIMLPAADGDMSGSYTATLRNAFFSLQRFSHSGAQAIPDDYNAQEMYMIALNYLYELAGMYNPVTLPDGFLGGVEIERYITRGPKAGQTLHGTRAVYAGCSAAVCTYIRKGRGTADHTFSVDHISQGSDFAAPESFDIPDLRSIDVARKKELENMVTLAIKKAAKNDEKAREYIKICNLIIKGKTQKEIAELMNGKSQSYISKCVDKIRRAIAELMDMDKNFRCTVGYTAYKESMENTLKEYKKQGLTDEQIRKKTRERQNIAEKAARAAMAKL